MRLPREFDAVEIRVLGGLLEKEQATPEYYPLTLNALVAACCQKSNREPVMQLSKDEVRDALQRLHEDVLVWPTQGARSERWRHNLDRRWNLEGPTKAIMTLLMLRGAQTPGELRGRSDRLHPFSSTAEVESALSELAGDPEPLVVRLQRRLGHKEARWAQLLGGAPTEPASMEEPGHSEGLSDRVERLEAQVAELESEMARFREFLE